MVYYCKILALYYTSKQYLHGKILDICSSSRYKYLCQTNTCKQLQQNGSRTVIQAGI